MRTLVIAAALLATASPLTAAEPCATLDSKDVAALFDDWNLALSSLDANSVTQHYWPDAVLLPTVSNTPRTNAAMIRDYFEHFLAKRPRGRIDTRTIRSECNVAMDAGTYTFSLMDDSGATTEVAARYTFVYQYRGGGWKILHHHSSAMPESGTKAQAADAHAANSKSSGAAQSTHADAAAPTATPKRSKRKGDEARNRPAEPDAAANEPAEPPAVETKSALFANLESSPPPSSFYPPESAKRKERGKVILKVCADDTGAVAGSPEIVKSSGFKSLDGAAQAWARAATWVPATLNRRRVEGCTKVDVAFGATA